MNTFSLKGVEITCGDTGKCFSFTCLQLKNLTLVKDYGSHDLDIVVALAQNTERCLPDKRKGFRQDLVQGFAVCKAVFKTLGLKREFLVLEALGPAFI